jgi:serine/threonine-protein kinase HipA
MRSAEIRINEHMVGLLIETDGGYEFAYYPEWLENPDAQPVSLTLPLSRTLYISNIMFPFFDGLIPEGWLLEIAQKNWKLNPRDRMGLLMACCRDCIGAVSIYPKEEDQE